MNFSDNLKKLRKESNLSQEELAEKLNVSRQSVSKWESGAAYPEMDKIIQISSMFNIGIDELLNKDIRDVQEEKQSKSNINKYIDDFLEFISKSIDMFLNMKFKQKCKFLLEEFIIGVILLTIFLIVGAVLSNIFYQSFDFISRDIFYRIHSILESIFTILAISLGVIIMLHVYKTRYLDYYVIVDKDDMKKDTDDVRNVVNSNVENMEFIPDRREKVIIRDPEHSGYRFINGLLKIFLILVKINVFFIFVGFCFSLVGFVFSLILSFMVTKTGLFFIGLLLGLLSCIIINIEVLNILFNFIISHKSKWKILFITFIVSLLMLGTSIGVGAIGFSQFDIEAGKSEVYEEVIPMRNDLIIHEYMDVVNYIESDNTDLRIVINHSKNMVPTIYIDDKLVNAYAYEDYDNIMKQIREQIKDINNKKIKSNYYYEVNIYTTKENIEILKNNYKNWIEGE